MQRKHDWRFTALWVLMVTACSIYSADAAQVSYRPEVTDLSGNTISSISAGSEFYFKLMVDDLRTEDATGVFSAYADVSYDSSLVSAVDSFVYSSQYPNAHSGTVEDGRFVNAGGLSGIYPLDGEEYEVFRVKMTAGQVAGDLTFATQAVEPDGAVLFAGWRDNPLWESPLDLPSFFDIGFHNMKVSFEPKNIQYPTLLYGEYEETTDIDFESVSLSVVPEAGMLAGTVPEPGGFVLLLTSILAMPGLRRRM